MCDALRELFAEELEEEYQAGESEGREKPSGRYPYSPMPGRTRSRPYRASARMPPVAAMCLHSFPKVRSARTDIRPNSSNCARVRAGSEGA